MAMGFSVANHKLAVLFLLLTVILAGCGPEITSIPADPQATPEQVVVTPALEVSTFQSPLPTPAQSPIEGRPPLCEFKGQAASEPSTPSRLDAFVFSEPQVVLTHTTVMDIAGWLPDNQRLLITRGIPEMPRQTIETLDTMTGERRVYAESQYPARRPFWLPDAQAVVYLDWEFIDKERGQTRWDLWISQESPQQSQRLVQGVWGTGSGVLATGMVVDPSGLLLRLSRTPANLSPLSEPARQFLQEGILAIDPAQLLYVKYAGPAGEQYRAREILAEPQPKGTQVALYADPYLFLADIHNRTICEVDLGKVQGLPRFPYDARWSQNGRYLAMLTTTHDPGTLFYFSNVTVLDTLTGEQKQLSIDIATLMVGIAWDPDNRHLLVQTGIDTPKWHTVDKLFLADVITGDLRPMLPNFDFGGGSDPGLQLAWSQDGQKIATKCSIWSDDFDYFEDRICLINVELKSR